jgi:hypothetical protein
LSPASADTYQPQEEAKHRCGKIPSHFALHSTSTGFRNFRERLREEAKEKPELHLTSFRGISRAKGSFAQPNKECKNFPLRRDGALGSYLEVPEKINEKS